MIATIRWLKPNERNKRNAQNKQIWDYGKNQGQNVYCVWSLNLILNFLPITIKKKKEGGGRGEQDKLEILWEMEKCNSSVWEKKGFLNTLFINSLL